MFLLSIKGNEDMEIGLNENLVILLVSKSTNLRKKMVFLGSIKHSRYFFHIYRKEIWIQAIIVPMNARREELIKPSDLGWNEKVDRRSR